MFLYLSLFLVGLVLGAIGGSILYRRVMKKTLGDIVVRKETTYQHEARLQLREDLSQANRRQQEEIIQQALLIKKVSRPIMHDLASPLTALEAQLSSLENEQREAVIRTIVRQSIRRTHLLQRLVRDARQLLEGQVRQRWFRADVIVREVTEIMRSEFTRNGINVTYKGLQSRVWGSPVLLERVIINVVLNAIEELAANNSSSQKIIAIMLTKKKRQLVISITDSGRGMKTTPADGMSRKAGHSGLGLSFVREVMEDAFQGGLTISSTKGKGTTVQLRLPLRPGHHTTVARLNV